MAIYSKSTGQRMRSGDGTVRNNRASIYQPWAPSSIVDRIKDEEEQKSSSSLPTFDIGSKIGASAPQLQFEEATEVAPSYDKEMSRLESLRKQAAVDLDTDTVNVLEKQMKNLRAKTNQQTVGDRASDVLSSVLSGSASDFTNLAGFASNAYSNPERDQRTIERLQSALDTGVTSDGQKLSDSQRKVLESRISELQQHKSEAESEGSLTNRIYRAADRMDDDSAKFQDKAKQGLGAVGSTVVDAATAFGQSALTGIAGAATGTGMAPFVAQAFGGAAQSSRREGANFDEQFLYGGSQAAKEYITEKLFGFAVPQKIAGARGSFDDVIEKGIRNVTERLAKTNAGQKALGGVLTWLAGGVTESLEEGIGALIDETIINPNLRDFAPDTRTTQQKFEDGLYEMLIGGVSGLLGVTNLASYSPGGRTSGPSTVDTSSKITYNKPVETVSPAAASTVKQTAVQAEKTRIQNPESEVLDAATTAWMGLGMNLKTAKQRAEITQKLIRGEEVSVREINKLDPTNKAAQKVFSEITGVQFPDTKMPLEQTYNLFRSASTVAQTAQMAQEAAQERSQMQAAERAKVETEIAQMGAEVAQAVRERAENAPVAQSAEVETTFLNADGAPLATLQEFTTEARAKQPDLSPAQISEGYNRYVASTATVEQDGKRLNLQEFAAALQQRIGAPVSTTEATEQFLATAQQQSGQKNEVGESKVTQKSATGDTVSFSEFMDAYRAQVDPNVTREEAARQYEQYLNDATGAERHRFAQTLRSAPGGEQLTEEEIDQLFELAQGITDYKEDNYGQTEDPVHRAGLHGLSDQRSRGQSRGVSGETGRAEGESGARREDRAGRGVQEGSREESSSVPREVRQEEKRLSLESVARHVTLSDGTEALEVVREAYTPEMQEQVEKFAFLGINVRVLVNGYPIPGTTLHADGVSFLGSETLLRANSFYGIDRIGDHELVHQVFHVDPELRVRVFETFEESVTDEAFKRLFDAYAPSYQEAYRDSDNAMDDIIEEIVADAYAGIDRYGAGASQFQSAVRAVLDPWIQTKTATYRAELALTDGAGNLVVESNDTGYSKFSMSTFKASGREILSKWLDRAVVKGDLTQKDANDILNTLDTVYEICDGYKEDYGPFSAWSEAKVVVNEKGAPVFSVVKANGDYAMNLDFSLVCKKRRTLDAVLNELVRRGFVDNLALNEKQIVKINELIRSYGFETACDLCFVDAKRYRQGKVADDFVKLYNDLVLSMVPKNSGLQPQYFNFGSSTLVADDGTGIHELPDAELDFTKIDKVLATKGEKTVEYKTAMLLKNSPADRKLTMRGDFLSTRGFDAINRENPRVLKLFNAKKGSGGPKSAVSDVQYLNEVLTSKTFTPEKAYAVGGVRIQSFSDYVPRMVFDYVQMIADLSAKKMPAHAYTKEELFVKQFGLTGMKINMSLIPKVVDGGIAPGLDADGNYAWADESFDFEEAKKIQSAEGYSRNCGTIAVGVSDEHIRTLMADPDIRMVIPYHKSGLSPIVAKMNKIDRFVNYTDFQNTRRPNGKHGKKLNKDVSADEKLLEEHPDFNQRLRALGAAGDPRQVAEEYVHWCEENNLLPKFDQFAYKQIDGVFVEQDGKRVVDENYYKLLEDFTVYNAGEYVPQTGLTMTFPTADSAFGSMADLIKRGLEEDAVLEGKRDAEVGKIVDEIMKFSVTEEAKNQSPYSYETLVRKPDIVVTQVPMRTVPTRGKKVKTSEIAHEIRAQMPTLHGPKSDQTYVHIPDLGRLVGVPQAGVVHGMAGNKTNSGTMSTAEVTYALPDILRNSVVVNELNPRPGSQEAYSYVLFGLAERMDGKQYLVKSTVNHFSDNRSAVESVEIYDVLKGIKARKTKDPQMEVFNSPEVMRSHTDNSAASISNASEPTISLAELLDVVKENYPELLPKSVREHYGITEPAQDPYARYSIDSEDSYERYNQTVVLEEKTVDKYLGDYASKSSPNYAQAYITRMTPDQFLKLTVPFGSRSRIVGQSHKLNMDEFKGATRFQPLQLHIDHETGEVLGHEGRHRAVALLDAGVLNMPVLLFDSSSKYDKTHIPELVLHGQDFGFSKSYELVGAKNLIPFSYANRDEILQTFTKQPSHERMMERYGMRGTVRYSIANPELSFADQVDLVRQNKLNEFLTPGTSGRNPHVLTNSAVYVAKEPNSLMQELGYGDLAIVVTQDHLRQMMGKREDADGNVVDEHNHQLTPRQVKILPKLLEKPAAVLRAKGRQESLIFVTTEKDYRGRPIIVPIKANGVEVVYDGISGPAHVVTSMYGRDNFDAFFENAVKQGQLVYYKKERIDPILTAPGYQSSGLLSGIDSGTIVGEVNPVVKDPGQRKYAITPQFEKWYKETYGTDLTSAQLKRRLQTAERRAAEAEHDKKAAELKNTIDSQMDLTAWMIHHTKKMREQKRASDAKLAEARKAKNEAVRTAIAETKELERAKAELQHDADRMAERRNAAKRLRTQENAYANKVTEMKENAKLKRNAAKAVLRDSRLAAKKRAEIETEQGLVDTIRKNPKQRTGVEKLQDAAQQLRTLGRSAYRNFVNMAESIDRFSKRQVSDMRAGTLVNILGGSASTMEAIFKKGLVDRAGNRIGESMSDVFLCWDEAHKKVNEGQQALLQDFMLHWHNIDRMSIVARAESALETFELNHEWLRDMDQKEFARLVAMTEKEVEKLGKHEAQQQAFEYVRLIRAYNEAQNKPIFADSNGNSVTAETSQRIVDQYLAEQPWLLDKANGIYEWWDLFMRNWAVGDTISEAEYNRMRQMYPHYVPTYRADKNGVGGAGFVGAGGATVSKAVKKAKGSHSEVMNIEDSFSNIVSKIIRLNRLNELYMNIVDTAMLDEDGTFADMAYFDWDWQDGVYANALITGSADIADLTDTVEETEKAGLEKVGSDYKLTGWKDGRKYTAYISEDLYKSIGMVTGHLANDLEQNLLKAGNTLTTPMKTAITGINPTFAIRNLSRDLPTAIINSISGLNFPKYYAQAAKEIVKNSDHWKTFQALGGTHATYYNDNQGFTKAMSRGQNPAAWAVGKMGAFNEITEAQTRFAEYLATVDKLGDTYEARLQGIKNAAEVTVDFSRKGRYGKVINAWVPYWNPAVQGIDKTVRSVIDSPDGSAVWKQASKTLGRAAMTTILFEAILYGVLKALDRDDEWEELNDRTKDTYYCIPLKDSNRFLKIPKNREWGAILGTPFMRMLEWANGREDPFENYIETAIEPNFLPPAIFRPDSGGGFATDAIGISQALDLAKNEDFAGRTIVPYAYQQGTLSQQFDNETSALAKKLGELFNWSPMQIDYIIGDYFGDFGDMFINATSEATWSGEQNIGETALEIVTNPFLADARYSNASVSKYYDLMDDLGRVVQDKKNQMGTDAAKGTIEYQTEKAIDEMYGKQISELNRVVRELPDGTEKDNAKSQIAQLTKEAIEFYNDSMAGKVSNPILTATYNGYSESVAKELTRMDSYSEQYSFKPRTTAPTSYVDPKNKKNEYRLDDEQKDYFKRLYREQYDESFSKLIQSQKYRNAKDDKKAALLEDARDDVLDATKEEFFAWLKKNGVRSTPKAK